MRQRTILKCRYCNKDFYPANGHLKRKFCSEKCGYLGKKQGGKKGKHYPNNQRAEIKKCVVCGKEFRAINDTYKRKQKYCSKECWAIRAIKINNCLFCKKEIKTSRIINKKYCNIECRNEGMVGKKLKQETKEKMSKIKKGKIPKNAWKAGNLHPMWNPNRTDQSERMIKKYIDWKYQICKRDKYTCQICGDKRSSGKKFCVDHIKPFSLYPELRFEVSNGRILCVECHRKTNTYGRKKIVLRN